MKFYEKFRKSELKNFRQNFNAIIDTFQKDRIFNRNNQECQKSFRKLQNILDYARENF